MPLAQHPSDLLDHLGGPENIRSCLLGRLDDVLELGAGADQLLVKFMRRLDLGDLAPRPRDRLAHLDQLGEDVARHGVPGRGFEHRPLDSADGFEQHVGLGGAVPPGKFGQEPTASGTRAQQAFQRGIGFGEAYFLRRFGLRWAGAVWGAFRHG